MDSKSNADLIKTSLPLRARLSLRHVVALLLVICITVVVPANRHRLEGLAAYGYLGILGLCFLANATVLLPAPSLAIVFAFGSVYSPFWVGAVGALGTTLGELTGYLAGYGGRPLVETTSWSQRLRGSMERYSAVVIFVMALAPLPVFDVAGIIAGSLGIGLLRFLLPCLAGKLIKMLAFSYLGAGLLPWLEPLIGRWLEVP